MLTKTQLRGVLNVAKPTGISSYDVIRIIKQIFKQENQKLEKIGHAGTLDPMASGVLLILFNEATKIARFLTEQEKEYIAEIRLGIKTDTDDITGRVIAEKNWSAVNRGEIAKVLAQFIGEINQIPPSFSALRQKGQRLYELARAGEKICPKPRRVFIDELDLLEFKPPVLVIRAVVGKGTYIRALARDIGERLGIGATLNRLTRTKIGDFKLEDAVDLKNLSFKDIKDHLCPLSKALSNLLTIYVKDTTIRKLISGQEIDCLEQKCPSRVFTRIWFDKLLKATPVKILDEEERAMLIGFYSFGRLKPVRLVYADLPKTE